MAGFRSPLGFCSRRLLALPAGSASPTSLDSVFDAPPESPRLPRRHDLARRSPRPPGPRRSATPKAPSGWAGSGWASVAGGEPRPAHGRRGREAARGKVPRVLAGRPVDRLPLGRGDLPGRSRSGWLRPRRRAAAADPRSRASSTSCAGLRTESPSPSSSSRAPSRRPARSTRTSATRASSRRRRGAAHRRGRRRDGTVASVSPPDLYVYDYDWSPDGRSFAAEAATGSGTNNYWLAQLYLVDARVGRRPLDLEAAAPARLPAFLSGRQVRRRDPRDHERRGLERRRRLGGARVVAAARARNLTPGMHWLRQPPGLAFAFGRDPLRRPIRRRLRDRVHRPATGRLSTLWCRRGEDRALREPRVPAARSAVAISESFESAARGLGRTRSGPGRTSPRQRLGEALLGRGEVAALASPTARASRDGCCTPKLRIRPVEASYPMVVVVHGGPAGASTSAWPSRWTATLPSQGYFVFLPNPARQLRVRRGLHRGQRQGLRRRRPARHPRGRRRGARGAAPVDPKRIGHHGLELRRLHGDVGGDADRPLRRRRRGRRHRELAELLRPEQDRHLDAPLLRRLRLRRPEGLREVLADRVHQKAKTPTLVLHGERDSEVPTPQGYEFWHALKTLGVPTRLVIYTDEGHSIRKPENQLDIVKRSVAWFDEYLKADERAWLRSPHPRRPLDRRHRRRLGPRASRWRRPSPAHGAKRHDRRAPARAARGRGAGDRRRPRAKAAGSRLSPPTSASPAQCEALIAHAAERFGERRRPRQQRRRQLSRVLGGADAQRLRHRSCGPCSTAR